MRRGQSWCEGMMKNHSPVSPEILQPILAAVTNREGESGRSLRLLDIGAGRSTLAATLTTLLPITVVHMLDYNDGALSYQRAQFEALRPGLQASFLRVDLNRSGLPAECWDMPYDIILLTEVLEHIAKPQTLLRTVADVLANNGVLIVSVPNGWTDRFLMRLNPRYMRPGDSRGHVRSFSAGAVAGLVRAAGVTPEWIRPIHTNYFVGHLALNLMRVPIDDDTGQIVGRYRAAKITAGLMRLVEISGAGRVLNPLIGRNILIIGRGTRVQAP
jgi:SAM-dependent methyltransferase